ncbi:glycosyltransferase family 4 protein [Citrobacter freundii]|nr:glycosyltransferase family 4 protein [Citrobacter freundii]MBC6508493.1 glycosyltransferase family 4 protein [Citrobacter freundii]
MIVTINHVMSSKQKSKIFDDIIDYFIQLSSGSFQHIVSQKPLDGPLVRHYHRPHLEDKLITPCVITVHHDLQESDNWLAIEKFTPRYKEANVVICLNTIQKEILASYGIKNTVIIPHGYNDKYIKPNLNIPRHWNGKVQIGIFSRRYPRKVKGEAYLLELMKRLDPALFSFVLIGTDRLITAGYLQSMGFETLCFEHAPYPIIADAYQIIDMLLMTSRYEGGPANIPEAVAAGVPVYCNPVGMAKDFIEDNYNGRHLSMDIDTDVSLHFNPLTRGNLLARLKEGALEKRKTAITWQESVHLNCQEYKKVINAVIHGVGG